MTIQPLTPSSALPSIARSAGKLAAKMIRVMGQLEARALQSSGLAFIPLRGRKWVFAILKLIIVVLAASFAISVSIAIFGLFVLAALPLSSSSVLPPVDDVSHPDHRFYHPERYDEYGSLK